MKQPRILVVRGGAIGDFITTLPAVGALRERWPEAHIEIVGYPHIIELANGRYYADAVRTIEARPMSGFFIPHAVLDPGWREYFGSFDVVISYLFDPDKVFADNVRACGSKQVIEASPRPADRHATEHYCQPLESLAIYVENPRPRLYPNESDHAAAARFFAGSAEERFVAIHPGSGSEKKNWPVEKFAAVARWLVDEEGAQLLVVQGEADGAVVGGLTGRLGERSYRVARGLRLVELAAVLARCRMFVGNDSGITHLAAAVNVPTVALFGRASVPIWAPRGARVQVVRMGDNDVETVRAVLAGWWNRQADC